MALDWQLNSDLHFHVSAKKALSLGIVDSLSDNVVEDSITFIKEKANYRSITKF